MRTTRCSSRRPRRTVPSWESEPIGCWPEPLLMDSTPAISVVPTAPSPTQSTASRPSAGVIWIGFAAEPWGTCSPDDIGYIRSLGGDGNCVGSGPHWSSGQVLEARDR
jgi:hypothetical protein